MQNQIQGKYNLELNFVDERIFLNFWDSLYGNDVACQVIEGKLYKFVYSGEEVEEDQLNDQPKIKDVFEKTEISLEHFINLVEKSLSVHF